MRFISCVVFPFALLACSSSTTQLTNNKDDGGAARGGSSGSSTGGSAGAGATGGGATGGSGGSAGTTGSGGSAGEVDAGADAAGDAGSVPIGVEGEPCAQVGDLACAGHAQKLQLRCDATNKWAVVGVCDATKNCETAAGSSRGSCQPIVTTCAGRTPADVVCDADGKKRISCGPDLVTSLDVQACSIYGSCKDDLCECGQGFTGDGVTCNDVNECNSAHGGCHPQASCANTIGSRTCTCMSGYQGDGLTCGDLNECLSNNGGCSAQANCANTPGSHTCTCKNGYSGDGVTCSDVDECATNNGGCAATGGKCTNTAGSRTCACLDGFEGDGLSCTRCGNGRYIVSGDGLYVTDSSNGKTWKRAIEPTTYTYDQAIARCAAIGLRLPTQAELMSLLEAAPANHINNCAFPGSPGTDFWTSTAHTDPLYAYYVRFGSNVASYSYKTDLNRARCLY